MPIEAGHDFRDDGPHAGAAEIAPAAVAPPEVPRRPRLSLEAANGWRGPGAIAIALAHFGIATDLVPARHLTPAALLVDLFFVLSGLVIAQAYGAKLADPANIPEYVVRRFGRIWPVQAATLGVLVAYEGLKALAHASGHGQFTSQPFAADGADPLSAIPTNLMLIQALGLHDRETWNFPSWSLSVEFATYVAFALFCLAGPALRRTLALAIVAGSIAILALVAPYGMRSTFDYGLFRCLAGFFAGTIAYEVAARHGPPRWRHPTLVELSALALVGLWAVLGNGNAAAFAAPLVFALFVAAFLGEGGRLSHVLRGPALQRLADLSFTIYMTHALVLLALMAGLHALARGLGVALFRAVPNPLAGLPGAPATVEVMHLQGALPWAGVMLAYVGGVTLATLAAYRFVEVPGRGLFARWGKRVAARLNPAARGTRPGRVPSLRSPS